MKPVDIKVVGTTVRATDIADNVVEIDTVGWDAPAPAHDLEATSMASQVSIAGRVTELEVTAATGAARTIEPVGITHVEQRIAPSTTPLTLAADRYCIYFSTEPSLQIRFDGEATVRRRESGRYAVSFDHPTVVTLGFASPLHVPEHTITIPASPSGVATALSHLSSAVGTSGPWAIGPSNRVHPPRIEIGDAVDVPDPVRERTPDTGIEIVAPDRFEDLFPLAPFGYYLGATVTVADRERPLLRAPDHGLTYEFPPLPALQDDCADRLWRLAHVDNAVRIIRRGGRLREWDVLSRLPIDPDEYAAAGPAERFQRTLEFSTAELDPVLPHWHNRVYVDPTPDHARVLPFALDRLAQVYLSDDARERAGTAASWPTPTGDDVVDPIGPFVGWFADDPPPLPYRGRYQAIENGWRFIEADTDLDRVYVVGTDPDCTDVVDASARRFENATFDLTVSVRHDVDRDELADLLATPATLVHVVGTDGTVSDDEVVCADSTLSPTAIDRCDAKLLVLDAPGSIAVADEFVRNGCAAVVARDPAVVSGSGMDGHRQTRREATSELPAEGRRRFLELLCGGFAVNHARRLAIEYTDVPIDLTVVGNGLARLSEDSEIAYRHLHEIEPLGNGLFVVTDHDITRDAGFYWVPDYPGSANCFMGQFSQHTTDWCGLTDLVTSVDDPIVYEGELYWPDRSDLFRPFV